MAEGTTVAIGEVIGVIDTGEDAGAESSGTEADEQTEGTSEAPETIQADELTPAASESVEEGPARRARSDRFYSPLVLRIAREERIDTATLESLEGTGKGGRVTRDDLLAYLERARIANPRIGCGTGRRIRVHIGLPPVRHRRGPRRDRGHPAQDHREAHGP